MRTGQPIPPPKACWAFQSVGASALTILLLPQWQVRIQRPNIAFKEGNRGKPLNLSIATPTLAGRTIDLIRRPVTNENTSNPAKLSERHYSRLSLRNLLSGETAPMENCTPRHHEPTVLSTQNGSGSTAKPSICDTGWDNLSSSRHQGPLPTISIRTG